MPDADAQLGHSMVTQAGARLSGDLQVIDLLARPERFELPTSWFVAMRSIQLSYGRAARSGTQLATDGPARGQSQDVFGTTLPPRRRACRPMAKLGAIPEGLPPSRLRRAVDPSMDADRARSISCTGACSFSGPVVKRRPDAGAVVRSADAGSTQPAIGSGAGAPVVRTSPWRF